jgi:hypothetical protein
MKLLITQLLQLPVTLTLSLTLSEDQIVSSAPCSQTKFINAFYFQVLHPVACIIKVIGCTASPNNFLNLFILLFPTIATRVGPPMAILGRNIQYDCWKLLHTQRIRCTVFYVLSWQILPLSNLNLRVRCYLRCR